MAVLDIGNPAAELAASLGAGANLVKGIEDIKASRQSRKESQQKIKESELATEAASLELDQMQKDVSSGLMGLQRQNKIKQEHLKAVELGTLQEVAQVNSKFAADLAKTGAVGKIVQATNSLTSAENDFIANEYERYSTGLTTYGQAQERINALNEDFDLPDDEQQGGMFMGLLARVAPKNIEHLRKMETEQASAEADIRKTQLLEQGKDARALLSERGSMERNRVSNLDRFTMMFPDGREAIELERDPVSGDVVDMTGRTLSDEELKGGVEYRATGSASELKAKDQTEVLANIATAKSLVGMGHSLFFNPDLDMLFGQLQVRGVMPKRLMSDRVQQMEKLRESFTMENIFPKVRALAPVAGNDVQNVLKTMPPTSLGPEVAKDWYLTTYSSGMANSIQAAWPDPAQGMIARNRFALMSIQDAVRAGVGRHDLNKLINSSLPDIRDAPTGAIPVGSYVGSNNKIYSPEVMTMFSKEVGLTADELIQTMGLVKAK